MALGISLRCCFRPVQFRDFEHNWRHMADKAAAENMLHPQDDPRYAVGSDVLMGHTVSLALIFKLPGILWSWSSAKR